MSDHVMTLGRFDPPKPPATQLSVNLEQRVAKFDAAVDRTFDRIRGNDRIDAAAAVVSNLADYGFVWAVVAGVKGRRQGPRRDRARRALTMAGASSSAVNAALKAVVKRQRPKGALRIGGEGAIPTRTPTTSSFPSGHTLAAFCTAVLLAETPLEAAAFVGFATAVAASRVHLRDHHPSDVVGGAAIGTVLGLGGRIMLGRSR